MDGRQIGVVVLLSANWREVRLCTKEIDEAILSVQPGVTIEVSIEIA